LKTGPAPEAEPWKQLVLSLEGRIRTHQQVLPCLWLWVFIILMILLFILLINNVLLLLMLLMQLVVLITEPSLSVIVNA